MLPFSLWVQRSCWVGSYSSSEHSQRGPSHPGWHWQVPQLRVPLPLLHTSLLGSSSCWHWQSHWKCTVTVRVSLNPTGLMVNVFTRSAGQPRTLASMEKLTYGIDINISSMGPSAITTKKIFVLQHQHIQNIFGKIGTCISLGLRGTAYTSCFCFVV